MYFEKNKSSFFRLQLRIIIRVITVYNERQKLYNISQNGFNITENPAKPNTFICLSIHSLCLLFSTFVYMCNYTTEASTSLCLNSCFSVRLCICMSVNLYVCASVCLCICMSVHLYVCASVCLSTPAWLLFCRSVQIYSQFLKTFYVFYTHKSV